MNAPRSRRPVAGAAIVAVLMLLAGQPAAVAETAPGTWSSAARTGFARQEVSYVQTGGKMYLAGGRSNVQQVYDPATNSWSTVAPLPAPVPLDHMQAAALNGKVYYIGGVTNWPETSVGSVYVYDVATNRFSTGGFAPLPTLRGGFATAVFGTEIAVIGGEGGGATFATVEAYDTATNGWRTLTSMPTARHGIQAAMWNGGAYIAAGGMRQGGGAPTDVHEVLRMTGTAATARPDAHIRRSSESTFVGNDVYNTTGAGQTKAVTSLKGERRSFVVRMQNDGSGADGLRLHGCTAAPGFHVRYFMGVTGTTEITAAVVNGTYTRSGVVPGGTAAVRLEVTSDATTASGAVQSCLLTVTSTSAPTVADAVLARVTVS